jgi:hypothetical protein
MGESLPCKGADHRGYATPPPRDPVARADWSASPGGNLSPGQSASDGPLAAMYASERAEDSQPQRSQATAGDKPAALLAGGEREQPRIAHERGSLR